MANDTAYAKVTDTIIASLEKGVVPWKKPWACVGGILPVNVASGKHYNGINLVVLGSQDFRSNVWGTFKQWKEKGAMVKKGESFPIVYWNSYPLKDKKTGAPLLDANGKQKRFGYYKHFNVWNAESVTGIDLAEYIPEPIESKFTPIEQAEKVVANMPNRPEINHNGGNRAYYMPMMDIIAMPQPDQFDVNDDYYSVLFHELGHSTGHASRLTRDLKGHSEDKESYSFEELIAELTSCFVCSNLGIKQSFDNSAAYIKSWLKALKDDNKMIIKAASKARQAAEYILDTLKEDTDTKA